jgi:hypothetical protein
MNRSKTGGMGVKAIVALLVGLAVTFELRDFREKRQAQQIT